jgi:hypothetical protein
VEVELGVSVEGDFTAAFAGWGDGLPVGCFAVDLAGRLEEAEVGLEPVSRLVTADQ